MSYVRFGEDSSDVYVYASVDCLNCCGCRMFGSYNTTSRTSMIKHLKDHQKLGDIVPESVFYRLEKERIKIGDDVTKDDDKRE